jgi:putative oxidoreductase
MIWQGHSTLQRLFSTFASGWPGKGLLLQRLVAGACLFYLAAAHHADAADLSSALPQMLAAAAGLFLVIGLWTPIAGIVVALAELWILIAQSDDPLISILLATVGMGLAMIGPGAWSIDARLFGRRHIGA